MLKIQFMLFKHEHKHLKFMLSNQIAPVTQWT